LPRIFNQLPSNLRAIAERLFREEAVGQICEDYDDVLAALDRLEVMQDVATDVLEVTTDSRYASLKRLQEELPMELIQILEEQLRGNSNDGEK